MPQLNQKSNGLYLNKIYRTTYTTSEIFAKYVFSHVSTYSFTDGCDNFCFGRDNPIATIMSNIRRSRQHAIKNLQMLPYMIDEYLSWESLEGTPFRKIENVLNSDSLLTQVSAPFCVKEELLLCIKDNLNDFTYNYKLDDNSNYTVKLSQTTKENIENILSEKYPDLCFYKKDNHSFNLKSQEGEVSRYQGAKSLTFKGEVKTLNIIRQDVYSLNLPIKIHQDILNNIITILENRFETFLINKNNE
jgi:hypothetical protein